MIDPSLQVVSGLRVRHATTITRNPQSALITQEIVDSSAQVDRRIPIDDRDRRIRLAHFEYEKRS
jgi:hypothetical protein